MKIPLELILERMAYLNPTVCLSDRGIWVSGVRMLPSRAENISKEYIYFCNYEDLFRTDQDLIFVAAAPGDAPCPQGKRCILLEPSAPMEDVFNDLLGLDSLLQNWERGMIQAMGDGPSLQRLLELSEPVLGNPIVVLDPAFQVLGCIKSFETDDLVFKELMDLGYITQNTFNTLKENGCFTEDHYTGNTLVLPPSKIKAYTSTLTAILDGTTVRYLVLMLYCNTSFSPGHFALFQFLLEKIRIVLTSMDDVLGEHREQYEYFLLDLLEAREMSEEEIAARSKCFLRLPSETFNCVVVRLNRSTDMYRKHAKVTLSNICAEWEPIVYKDTILFLTQLGNRRLTDYYDTQSKLEQLQDFLIHADAKAGISNQFTSYQNIRTAYSQGIAALDLGVRLNPNQSEPYWFSDYAVYQILTAAREKLSLDSMLHPLIRELYDYDRTYKTQYLPILEAYLRNEDNYTNAARELHMHRNNVIYHVKRMCELFHFHLDDSELRLQLSISFKVFRLLQAEQS